MSANPLRMSFIAWMAPSTTSRARPLGETEEPTYLGVREIALLVELTRYASTSFGVPSASGASSEDQKEPPVVEI